jgi:hypothetical protein
MIILLILIAPLKINHKSISAVELQNEIRAKQFYFLEATLTNPLNNARGTVYLATPTHACRAAGVRRRIGHSYCDVIRAECNRRALCSTRGRIAFGDTGSVTETVVSTISFPLPSFWILLTTATMNYTVLWVATQRNLERSQRFGGTYRPQARRQQKQVTNRACRLLLLVSFGLLLDPEDGGHILLRNVGLSPNYTALQPGRPYSSS